MKIAHFLVGRNPEASGVTRAAVHLAIEQAELGHDVSLWCVTKKPGIPIPPLNVVTFKPSPIPGFPPLGLHSQLLRERPDFIHIHSVWLHPNWAAARLLRRLGVQYSVTPHGGLAAGFLWRHYWPLKLAYKFLCELPTLNRAAFVHSVGDDAQIRSFGTSAPIVLAPNGFDFSQLPSDPARGFLEGRTRSIRKRLVLGFLGRIDIKQKGLDILLEAYARIRRQDTVLVLAGPDFRGGVGTLKRLAARLGIADEVLFLGQLAGRERFDYLCDIDFFVHPSRWEGLPLAVLEACACGRPCIVGKAADCQGMITRYGAGLVCEPDAEAVSEALSTLLSLPEARRREMGERGREMVRREFAWKTAARTLTDAVTRHIHENRTLPDRTKS